MANCNFRYHFPRSLKYSPNMSPFNWVIQVASRKCKECVRSKNRDYLQGLLTEKEKFESIAFEHSTLKQH